MTGLDQPWAGAWSPSGRRVLLRSGRLIYLLDLAEPSLERIPGVGPWEPVLWSEMELLWMDEDGRVLLRNLETGEDWPIHDFGGPVSHYIRPGDTHYVVNRERGAVTPGYHFGTIVAGELGGDDEQVLIETGHLIGRMASGQVLAVEGLRGRALSPCPTRLTIGPGPVLAWPRSRQAPVWFGGTVGFVRRSVAFGVQTVVEVGQ